METSVEVQSVACPSCGDVISNPRYFCPHCTRPIRNTVTCECCKEPISAEAKKCPHCIETFGGAAEDMGQHGLRHEDALNVSTRIKEVISR